MFHYVSLTSVIAAKAFQYMTMILVSVVLLLVTVKAFTTAPLTGKLGLPMGIVLLVSSVFQLLALALMITACHERETAASRVARWDGRCVV